MGKFPHTDETPNASVNMFVKSLKNHRKSIVAYSHRKSLINGDGSPNSPTNPFLHRRKSVKGSIPSGKNALAVPGSEGHSRSPTRSKQSNVSGDSHGSSGGSSGGGSDGSGDLRKRTHRKAKNKKKDKKDTLLARVRDAIAESDVFLQYSEESPHVTCIRISFITLIPFAVLLLWDTLAVLIFERPHLSMIDYAGFALIFQFVAILFAMYGYAVQFVTTGYSGRNVTIANIALQGQLILFLWRIVIEVEFDGYRYEEENYLPRKQ